MKPPCYKCADRYSTCHVSCARYAEFVEQVKAAKENERRDKLYYRYLLDRKEKRLEIEHKRRKL